MRIDGTRWCHGPLCSCLCNVLLDRQAYRKFQPGDRGPPSPPRGAGGVTGLLPICGH